MPGLGECGRYVDDDDDACKRERHSLALGRIYIHVYVRTYVRCVYVCMCVCAALLRVVRSLTRALLSFLAASACLLASI